MGRTVGRTIDLYRALLDETALAHPPPGR
jgi:hypothetical protein